MKRIFIFFTFLFLIQYMISPALVYAATDNAATDQDEEEGEEDEEDEEDEDEEDEDEEVTEEEGEEGEEIPGDEGEEILPEEGKSILEQEGEGQIREGEPATLPIPPSPFGNIDEEQAPIVNKVFKPENIIYKRRYWREIDFGIPANSGYFFRDHEIMIYILKAIQSGRVKAYDSYEKTKQLSLEEINERLKLPETAPQEEEGEEWGIENPEPEGVPAPKTPKTYYFLPREITTIELEEDVCFDTKYYEWYHKIRSVKIIIPKSRFETGVRKEVCVVDFDELIEYLETYEPDAVWRNKANSAANKKLSIALKERMFSSLIVKVENPSDAYVGEEFTDPLKKIEARYLEETRLEELKKSLYQY